MLPHLLRPVEESPTCEAHWAGPVAGHVSSDKHTLVTLYSRHARRRRRAARPMSRRWKTLERTPGPRVCVPLDYGIRVEQITRPRVQNASRLPALGTGSRAFNASDGLPPNAMAAATMMMGRTPVMSYFLPTLSGSWRKVQGGTALPGVTFRQTAPRGIIVNTSLYGMCPIHPALKAIGCSTRKDLSGPVSALTTLDATPEELHAHAVRRQTRSHAREYMCHHRQVRYYKTRRATPVRRPRFDQHPHPCQSPR
jgi:hypothetical protein